VKEKFVLQTKTLMTAWTLIKPATASAYKEMENTMPEFGKGAAGYGRYFWHTTTDEVSEEYMVGFVLPVVTRQDSRYYVLGRDGFWRRTEYALSRVLVTRNDAGREVFNSSEIVGAGAAAGLSNLYYPSQERTFHRVAENWGLNVGFDAATFATREFWSDVNRKLFGKKQ
jgi:hypothetical protein